MCSKIEQSDCFTIGVLSKTHGVKGDFILKLKNTFHTDNIKKLEHVFISIDELLVPFFISALSVRNQNALIVSFQEIKGVEKAEEFVGYQVMINNKYKDLVCYNEQKIKDYVDYIIIDSKFGVVGKVCSIEGSGDNPLFRIFNNNKEVLIPVNNDFMVKIDDAKKTINLEIPDGLLDSDILT